MSQLSAIWAARILLLLSFIFCYIIIMIELYNRSQMNTKNKNSYQKWLNKVSFLIIFTSGLSALQTLAMTIPSICKYVSVKYFQFDILCHFLLTYYQIIRLHYCFRKNYSKVIFIGFYLNGIFLFIYLTIFSNLTIEIHINEQNMCRETADTLYSPLLYPIIPYVWYFIWDSLVLMLYIINIRRLRHQLTLSLNANNDNNDNQRKVTQLRFVNRVLRKVLILTVLIQMMGLIIIIIVSIIPDQNWPIWIAYTVKPPLVSLLMYYLLQHNHKHYVWMVKHCISCYCCCCCQEYIYQTIPNTSHTASQGMSSSDDNIINNNNQNNNIMQLSEIINSTYGRSEDEMNENETDDDSH